MDNKATEARTFSTPIGLVEVGASVYHGENPWKRVNFLNHEPQRFSLHYVTHGGAAFTTRTKTGETGHWDITTGMVYQRNPEQCIDFVADEFYQDVRIQCSVNLYTYLRDLGLLRVPMACWSAPGADKDLVPLYHILARHTGQDIEPVIAAFLNGVASWRRRVQQEDATSLAIARACELLAQVNAREWDMRHLAEHVGIGYELFRKAFRKQIGCSPWEFHLRARIEQACTLLTDRSIMSVAEELGYSDLSAFSRQFKRYVGMSPRQWQQRLG